MFVLPNSQFCGMWLVIFIIIKSNCVKKKQHIGGTNTYAYKSAKQIRVWQTVFFFILIENNTTSCLKLQDNGLTKQLAKHTSKPDSHSVLWLYKQRIARMCLHVTSIYDTYTCTPLQRSSINLPIFKAQISGCWTNTMPKVNVYFVRYYGF